MLPIAQALQLKTYEEVTAEILQRQHLAPNNDTARFEIRKLLRYRNTLTPNDATIASHADKLFKMIGQTMPKDVHCTLILHRNGGNNFIAFSSPAQTANVIEVLETIIQELRKRDDS